MGEPVAAGPRPAQFLEAYEEANLEQLVTFPTQVRGNTMDLLLTNIPDRVMDITDVGRLGRSDHNMILFSVSLKSKADKTEEQVPNWNRADWPAIRHALTGTNWPDVLHSCTASEAWAKFRDTIMRLVDKHVPSRPRRQPNKPVWMNREVLRAVRKKRRLWKKARCGTQEMSKYKEAVKDTARKIRNAKRNFEKKLSKEKPGSSRPFFSYVKGKTKSRVTIGPLKDKQKCSVSRWRPQKVDKRMVLEHTHGLFIT